RSAGRGSGRQDRGPARQGGFHASGDGARSERSRRVAVARTAASAKLPVTFSVVRNISGIVSTASRIPIPSTGTFAAFSTGTIAMMLPKGMPGTANDVSTTVKTIDATSAGPTVTP